MGDVCWRIQLYRHKDNLIDWNNVPTYMQLCHNSETMQEKSLTSHRPITLSFGRKEAANRMHLINKQQLKKEKETYWFCLIKKVIHSYLESGISTMLHRGIKKWASGYQPMQRKFTCNPINTWKENVTLGPILQQ